MYGTPYIYIMQCKFLFLFNGPLMPNVVQLCLAANNILLMHKWNHTFLLITLVWKCRLLRFPKIFVKNKLGNQMIKQFLNSVIVKYVTLHVISGTKVMTRSQHANTTRLVCPKTHFMCIFNYWNNQWHTMFCFGLFSTLILCFSQVWSMTRLVCKVDTD